LACSWVAGEPYVAGDESADVRWWPLADLPPMAARMLAGIEAAASGRAPRASCAEPRRTPSGSRAGAGGDLACAYSGAVLTIDQATFDAIVAHAKRDHPDEACGIVAGPIGTDRPERLVEMVNAAGSPTFYEFDSMDLLQLYKEMDDRDEEPVVIYHSHTATEAYPSRTDIGLASEPNAHYVLVSTREHGNNEGPVEFRSYRILDGEVTEEEVVVVPALG